MQIAGGTGITPMLQVIDAIVKNPDDNTQVRNDLFFQTFSTKLKPASKVENQGSFICTLMRFSAVHCMIDKNISLFNHLVTNVSFI